MLPGMIRALGAPIPYHTIPYHIPTTRWVISPITEEN